MNFIIPHMLATSLDTASTTFAVDSNFLGSPLTNIITHLCSILDLRQILARFRQILARFRQILAQLICDWPRAAKSRLFPPTPHFIPSRNIKKIRQDNLFFVESHPPLTPPLPAPTPIYTDTTRVHCTWWKPHPDVLVSSWMESKARVSLRKWSGTPSFKTSPILLKIIAWVLSGSI